MSATDIQSIYETALRNTHALEQQGLRQIQLQLSGLERYPEYRSVLEHHVPTVRTHLTRLEKALKAAGSSPSGVKEAVTGLAGTLGAAIHAAAPDETLKNLFAGYAFQYDQIAAYKSLIVIAEAAGRSSAALDFRASIAEEREAAQAIDGIIESVTRNYLRLATSEVKADR